MHPPPKSGPHKSGEQGLGSQVFDLADADSVVKHSIAISILFGLYFSCRCLTTIAERKRPLSDLSRGPEKALGEIRREARKRVAPYLCISIVTLKVLRFSRDDCFAAFCLVNRDWLSPSRMNAIIIPFFCRLRMDCNPRQIAVKLFHITSCLYRSQRSHCTKIAQFRAQLANTRLQQTNLDIFSSRGFIRLPGSSHGVLELADKKVDLH